MFLTLPDPDTITQIITIVTFSYKSKLFAQIPLEQVHVRELLSCGCWQQALQSKAEAWRSLIIKIYDGEVDGDDDGEADDKEGEDEGQQGDCWECREMGGLQLEAKAWRQLKKSDNNDNGDVDEDKEDEDDEDVEDDDEDDV